MKTSRHLSGILLGILFVFALSALFGSCKKDSASPNSVTIQNNAFSPSSITVSVNSTVTWTNKDNTAHTVTSTSSNDTYDSGNMDAGGTFSHKFTAAGTYDYKCTLHSGMTGTVVVQ